MWTVNAAAPTAEDARIVPRLSTKPECDLSGWIKNGHTRKNLTPNGEPQRYSLGTQKKKKRLPGFSARVVQET